MTQIAMVSSVDHQEQFYCIICKRFYLLRSGANANVNIGGWYCMAHAEEELDVYRALPKKKILDRMGVVYEVE